MTALERHDDLIRSREAAGILRRDIRTVHRWAEDGRLPVAVRVPGYRGGFLFHRSEIEEVRMEQSLETAGARAVNVDTETLRYLGYDPASIPTRALVLLAQRYELDPLLGEIQLVDSKSGTKLYVTRDGMLAVAHRSGVLDGIVVEKQRRNSTDDGWSAYVSVWRKDMSHPFTYGAQCKDSEPQAKLGNGPEMALARAERRALRRAFQIRTDFYPDRPNQEFADVDKLEIRDDVSPETRSAIRAQLEAETALTATREWVPSLEDQAAAHKAGGMLGDGDLAAFLRKHGIRSFENEWPPTAVAEILADVDPPGAS